MKFWARDNVVYIDILRKFGMVAWYAVGYPMVEVFWSIFVRCLMRDDHGQKSQHADAIDLVPPISRGMVGFTLWYVAYSF